MELEQALKVVRAAGYKVTAPRQRKENGIQTTNPFNHPFPHAKLRNVTLSSINRLSKVSDRFSSHLIPNNDLRNYSITGKVPA